MGLDPRGGGLGAKASAPGDPVSAALHGDWAPCCRVLWGHFSGGTWGRLGWVSRLTRSSQEEV